MISPSIGPLRDDFETNAVYDLMIAVCGYEERSSFIPRRLAGHYEAITVVDYQAVKLFAYDENRDFYTTSDARFMPADVALLAGALSEILTQLAGQCPANLRICIDASSMDRDVLATAMAAVYGLDHAFVSVDFVYAPAGYQRGLQGSAGSITVNRPVKGMEGWAYQPDAPLVCMLGLGFEDDLIIAAIEALEPSETIAYAPVGLDARYDNELKDRLRGTSIGETWDYYDVHQPLTLFRELTNTSKVLTARGQRVVLVPVGPKIFAIVATLVGLLSNGIVSLWRVSAANARTPEDRIASGSVTGLSYSRRRIAVSDRDNDKTAT